MSNISLLLDAAVSAALDAGKAVLEVYNSDFAVEHKEDRSPLTLADKRAHEIILKRLASDADSLPVLSEEGKNIPYETRRKWSEFWLVDPVDGTKEFIKRNGEFTVNIALIRDGKPVLGVIFVPVRDTLYFAADEKGAWKLDRAASGGSRENAARLPLADRHSRPFTAVASRSHLSPETEAYLSDLKTQHGRLEIVSAGSSLKFCLVAEGRADVYPRFGPTMEWDTAAGHAIVLESGGSVVTTQNRAPLTYNKKDLLNPWFIAAR